MAVAKKKKESGTTPVRLKRELVKKVKVFTKGTGQTISGFVNVAIENALAIKK